MTGVLPPPCTRQRKDARTAVAAVGAEGSPGLVRSGATGRREEVDATARGIRIGPGDPADVPAVPDMRDGAMVGMNARGNTEEWARSRTPVGPARWRTSRAA